jgi:recombination protein RecT
MNETNDQAAGSAALTKPTPQAPAPVTKYDRVRGLIESDRFRDQIAKALPKHLPPDRFLRVALTALTRTPRLAECDQASLFGALMSLSQLGIEPDGRRAHLIPFENRKRGVVECQLIVDYKGLVELAMRSGTVSLIHADVVCDRDVFVYDRGEIKTHSIDFRQDRGPVFAVYSICRFKDGTEKAEVMSRTEVEAVRSRSRAGGSGPWVTDWSEMAKKTVFRRLSKWLPLSPEFRDVLDVEDDRLESLDAGSIRRTPPAPRKLRTTIEPDPILPAADEFPGSEVRPGVPAQTDGPGPDDLVYTPDPALDAQGLVDTIEAITRTRNILFRRVLKQNGVAVGEWKEAPESLLRKILADLQSSDETAGAK